ncbi:Zn-dependent hydrolase [Leptolyngbya sp. PCC 6406]|uniref:Zn-dependent hydrolase n=1 Tax=Leptolyngbya sp. PCC 6406 TaxID=1173264 RepID=UPI0002AB9BAA|nr:Zn-dependent hydrolase [Leptolyngbya sp. PCC 6406]
MVTLLSQPSRLTLNGDRLNQRIEILANLGRQSSGYIRRLAFTPEDLQARQQVQTWMAQAGMTVRIDAAGNIIGRYPGQVQDAPALATGSHIDTVPSGGRFDGVLGVLAGIEAIAALQERHLRLRHPLEVIVFTDEESTMIGCQAMAGTVQARAADYHPADGTTLESCLERVGGNWDEIATALRSRSDLAAFVELHVEQGAVLEHQQRSIGVVEGVVGIRRWALSLTGEANHAGTTPMDLRHDALVAAAEITLAVRRIALQQPGNPVATVGYLNVLPNAVNIVPGRVDLSVDMRDLSCNCLHTMEQRLKQEAQGIAATHGVAITFKPLLCVEPTPAAPGIQGAIATVCDELGLSHCSLPSRAGHDALEIGRITDMGMIFVPSQAGISHSQAEYTSPEQCTQGATVLLHTFLKLDTAYPTDNAERVKSEE